MQSLFAEKSPISKVERLVWYTIPLTTVGGGERVLLEGLKWFRDNGIEAHLFADGEPVEKEALFDTKYSPSVLIFPEPRAKGGLRSIFQVYRKVKFLRSVNPDVILANSQAEAWKIYFYNLFSPRKIPYACFIHGSFFQFPGETDKYALIFRKAFSEIRENDRVYKELVPRKAPGIPFFRRVKGEVMNYLRYRAVRGAKTVFVMTRKQKKEIELLYDHPHVIVNHGAFSREIFHYKIKVNKKEMWGMEGKTLLLSVCRLVPKKRVDVIIRSFGLYHRKNTNARLMIAGNGPEKANLQRLAKESGIEEVVQFLGYVPDDELLDYYSSSDLFVTADNADYDITTFVALALGKKVVASSQHEFESHLTGLNLVFQADPTAEGFASGFEQAFQLDRRPTQSAEELLKDYTWEYYFSGVRRDL